MDYRLGVQNKRNGGGTITAGITGKTRNGMARWRVGVDSGGTFTDICLFDEQAGRIETWKVPSTPGDPSRGTPPGLPEGRPRRLPHAKHPPAAPPAHFAPRTPA